MKALLSIKPEFATSILTGIKRFEYRRVPFAQPVDSVVLYASSPVRLVVGEFRVKRLLQAPLDTLWRSTRRFAGISRSRFYEYFRALETGFAIEVDVPYPYKTPFPLNRIYSSNPPQSFAYLHQAGLRTTRWSRPGQLGAIL
jgi:predicted transcriptional regulator